MLGVVLRDQRRGVEAYRPGQRADVPAGVDGTAAGGEVVRLDGVHDGDTDTGGAADVVDGEPGRDTCLLQGPAHGGMDFLGLVLERTLVFRGVADGHGGAFRACEPPVLEVQSRGVPKGGATGR